MCPPTLRGAEILRALRAGDLTVGEISGRNQMYSQESTVFQEFLQQMLHLLGKDEAR